MVMKKRYFLAFLSLLPLRSFAQPILNDSNSFNIGITVHLFVDTSPTLGEGSGGANQTWDFSSLFSPDSAMSFYAIPASSTPYASNFPDAQIATLNIDAFGDSVYNYFTNDNQHFTL